jgi:hypothetical protein
MPALRLALSLYDTMPALAGIDGARPTSQTWRGGRCVGGTLDPSLRGKADGPVRWCAIRDLSANASVESARLLEQINPGDRMSPDGAGALFIVEMDIAAEAEADFNDWYNTEHIPLLTAVPGVICARRFRSLDETPRYVAIYHLDDASAYASEPWRAADQTPWIQRMRQFQSNRRYAMYYPPAM